LSTPYDTSGLRRAWLDLEDAEPPAGACPESERIWEAARGELDAVSIRELVDHVAECSACAEAWRLAAEMAPAGAGQAEVEPHPRARRAGPWLALAASVLLAVTLAWPLVDWPWREPIERGGEPGVESLLADGEALPRHDFELAWRPGPEGAHYDLLVTTPDLEVVYQASDLESASHRVPMGSLDAVPAGGELLWRVEMSHPDGRRVASPAFRVSVR
jgi:hypothetical protein